MTLCLNNFINSNTKKYSLILEEKLNFKFSDIGLLSLALTHSSLKNEQPELYLEDNEKLEFIGDSVFDLIVSKFLYDSDESLDEGDLTAKRSNIVNEKSLSNLAKKLLLHEYIMISKSGRVTNILTNDKVLADGFEALIGAIFLDSGYKKTENIIIDFLKPFFVDVMNKNTVDYKSQLCIYIDKMKITGDEYRLVEASGPSHDMSFVSEFYVGNILYGKGRDKTKKGSEKKAAKEALKNLKKIYGEV